LAYALKVLEGVDGIDIIRLKGVDVMRHRLVRSVITAFDSHTK